MKGIDAAREVGVSRSAASLWFIDAGAVDSVEAPAGSGRFFSPDDRIEIAGALAPGEPVKSIATKIGKSDQSVNREIGCNRRPTVATSRGSLTARLICGGDGHAHRGWRSTTSYAKGSRPSWPSGGT